MTLDEAIKHCKEVAKQQEVKANELYKAKDFEESRDCIWCSKEHEQLATWLKELKKLKEKAEPQLVHYVNDRRFEDDDDAYCPNCNELLNDHWGCGYCLCCGQALEW